MTFLVEVETFIIKMSFCFVIFRNKEVTYQGKRVINKKDIKII